MRTTTFVFAFLFLLIALTTINCGSNVDFAAADDSNNASTTIENAVTEIPPLDPADAEITMQGNGLPAGASLASRRPVDDIQDGTYPFASWVPSRNSIKMVDDVFFGFSHEALPMQRILGGGPSVATLVNRSIFTTAVSTPRLFTGGSQQGGIFASTFNAYGMPTSPGVKQPMLVVQSAVTPAANWVFATNYSTPEYSDTWVGVAANGSLIVASLSRSDYAFERFFVFSPTSNVPLRTFDVGIGMSGVGRAEKIYLSKDGSTLLVAARSQTKIIDVATGTLRFAVNTWFEGGGNPLYSAAISADGGYVALGWGNGRLKVFKRLTTTTYDTNYYSTLLPNSWANALAIGSTTLVIGSNILEANSHFGIGFDAFNLETRTAMMHYVLPPTTQNFSDGVAEIAVSNDGQTFVAATNGDAGGVRPEGYIFRSVLNDPLATLQRPGSMTAADISSDGRLGVFGYRAEHINVGNIHPGGIDVVTTDANTDLVVDGTPRINQNTNIRAWAAANLSLDLYCAAQPADLRNSNSRTLVASAPSGADGIATFSVPMSGIIGEAKYCRAYNPANVNGRAWTRSIIKVVPF